MNNKHKFLILIILPLLFGFLVYLYFREGNFLYEKILCLKVDKIKLNNANYLYYWLKFSFPDAVYIFSISNWFLLVNFNKLGFFISFIFYIFLILLEILQYIFSDKINWLGTYDSLDLLSYSIGYILSLIIMMKIQNVGKNKVEKKYGGYMFCENCGKEIDEIWKFCRHCGVELEHIEKENKIEKSCESAFREMKVEKLLQEEINQNSNKIATENYDISPNCEKDLTFQKKTFKNEEKNVVKIKLGTIIKIFLLILSAVLVYTMYLTYTKYDKNGFNIFGIHKITKKKLDVQGYNKEGYNKEGYNKEGYNKIGYDIKGWNKEGINENTKSKYDKKGYNINGYDREGYDKFGYDKFGYNKEGYNREGYTKESFSKIGYNKDGYDIDGYDINGYNREGYDKYGWNKSKTEKVIYRNTGQITERTNYKNGEKDGLSIQYYKNGNILRKGYFSNGKEVGHWETYYDNGKIMEELDY